MVRRSTALLSAEKQNREMQRDSDAHEHEQLRFNNNTSGCHQRGAPVLRLAVERFPVFWPLYGKAGILRRHAPPLRHSFIHSQKKCVFPSCFWAKIICGRNDCPAMRWLRMALENQAKFRMNF